MSVFQEEEYNKNFDLKLWKKVVQFIKNYTGTLLLITFFMIFLAGIDVMMPYMTKYAIDNFVMKSTTEGLGKFTIIYLALMFIQCLNIYFFIDLAGKVETGITYDIRRAGFRKLQQLSFSYYDKRPVGWLMARMTSDCLRLGEFLAWGLVDMVWGLAMMIGIIGMLFYLNAKLAVITLTVVPAVVIMSWIFRKMILKIIEKLEKPIQK